MKPLTFNVTGMAVKMFLDKFKACSNENRWKDEQKLVQLQNQLWSRFCSPLESGERWLYSHI